MSAGLFCDFTCTHSRGSSSPSEPRPTKPAAKWVHLSRDGGPDGFHDRSSRPRRSPRQTNQLREAAISGARQQGSYRGIKPASGERASSSVYIGLIILVQV